MSTNGKDVETFERQSEAQAHAGAAEYVARRLDERSEKEQAARVGAVKRSLEAKGLVVARRSDVASATRSDAHPFLPYPQPLTGGEGKGGCVRCPYPKGHVVHSGA